ncbi:MarC family protein [Ruficoccus amylovorans]|uniref:UPF0056 membrane protein n=1 Tax=Ruficoccus amylovorans TaxID=1804625 RepID=A0A842HH09_9BACT|nr:MarC family protein [Ruficoccus amylovorans]MBC2595702.1 MarC family protein [Ruficoccus amylovorans]
MFLAFISVWIKFFLLLTPFFVLSVFLTYTANLTASERRSMAVRVTLAVLAVVSVLLFFGGYLFDLFGITLDAFRVGAGTLLFLSGIALARESARPLNQQKPDIEDMKTAAVVPLAIPVTVGPATTGTLLVMGADMREHGLHLPSIVGVLLAVVGVGVLLFLSAKVERVLGKLGITILSRLTGLMLTALAAQILFDGIRGLMAVAE